MSQPVVVLDPGHGGRQPGAVANGIQEKEVNLQLALLAAKKLEEQGSIEVHLTREEDKYVSLGSRVEKARNRGADLFLSLHANAGGGEGFESFIYRGLSSDAPEKEKQRLIHASIMKELSPYEVVDRGRKKANFFVLKNSQVPAVLIESLFLDDPREAELWKSTAFVESLAQGVVKGINKALLEGGEQQSEKSMSGEGGAEGKTPSKDPTGDRILYCIQVGAFSQKERARRRLQEAYRAGFADAFIFEKEIP